MIDEKRLGEIREQLAAEKSRRLITAENFALIYQAACDLLTALNEAEADNTALQASLSRARNELRMYWVSGYPDGRRYCKCKGKWDVLAAEQHLPVTINNITGPCPAAPEEK